MANQSLRAAARGLGKGGGQEGHGCSYKRATWRDPGSDGMFCILTEGEDTDLTHVTKP